MLVSKYWYFWSPINTKSALVLNWPCQMPDDESVYTITVVKVLWQALVSCLKKQTITMNIPGTWVWNCMLKMPISLCWCNYLIHPHGSEKGIWLPPSQITYGVSNESYELILHYLVGKQQCVKIGIVKSDGCELREGVSQGSILGPLLFNIFYKWFILLSWAFTYLL